MVIRVDNQAKAVIESLCDAALRAGGLRNLASVNLLMRNLRSIDDCELNVADKSGCQAKPSNNVESKS